MDLIIVESPSKAKTISKYLKGKYKVDASGGHVRDLPEKTLGVKVTGNFEPKYEITPSKKDVIKRLTAEAAKADRVYLATDPDREGEAIRKFLRPPSRTRCRSRVKSITISSMHSRQGAFLTGLWVTNFPRF